MTRFATPGTWTISSQTSSARSRAGRRDVSDRRESDQDPLGITVYGCGQDEAWMFQEMAPRFGVVPTMTADAVSQDNIELTSGNGCISISHKSQVDEPILLGLSKAGVEYISTRSIGYNHVDVKFAESVGISVENISYSPDSVADYALMLMLMLVRNAKWTLRRVQDHDYRLHGVRGLELRDMTVGVIGTGRIGSAVMSRLQGFGCRVVAYDRCQLAPTDYVSLSELLEVSDLVTLHTPLTADTHHLLNRERLEQMRHGAFLVNTGRGPLIDTESLLWALERGRIGGAALDVLEGEEGIFYFDYRDRPVENQQLLRLQQLPNVVVSPHTAYYTSRSLSDAVEETFHNCLRFENGRARCRS